MVLAPSLKNVAVMCEKREAAGVEAPDDHHRGRVQP
jgi:hypothetical protein